MRLLIGFFMSLLASSFVSAEEFYDPSRPILVLMADGLSSLPKVDVANCYGLSDQLHARAKQKGFKDERRPSTKNVWRAAADRQNANIGVSDDSAKAIGACERAFEAAFQCAIEEERAKWLSYKVILKEPK